METGTSCKFCTRRCAVTVTDSILPLLCVVVVLFVLVAGATCACAAANVALMATPESNVLRNPRHVIVSRNSLPNPVAMSANPPLP